MIVTKGLFNLLSTLCITDYIKIKEFIEKIYSDEEHLEKVSASGLFGLVYYSLKHKLNDLVLLVLDVLLKNKYSLYSDPKMLNKVLDTDEIEELTIYNFIKRIISQHISSTKDFHIKIETLKTEEYKFHDKLLSDILMILKRFLAESEPNERSTLLIDRLVRDGFIDLFKRTFFFYKICTEEVRSTIYEISYYLVQGNERYRLIYANNINDATILSYGLKVITREKSIV